MGNVRGEPGNYGVYMVRNDLGKVKNTGREDPG